MCHAQQASRFQDVERAANICAESGGGACLAGGAKDRGGVVDAVRSISTHRFEDMHQLADVATGEFDLSGEVRRTARKLRAAGEENHLLSVGQQLPRQIDTDETRPAGDQVSTHDVIPLFFTRATARTHAPPAR